MGSGPRQLISDLAPRGVLGQSHEVAVGALRPQYLQVGAQIEWTLLNRPPRGTQLQHIARLTKRLVEVNDRQGERAIEQEKIMRRFG